MLFCENAEKIRVLFLYYYIFFPQRSQSYIFSSCCTILTIDMVLPCFLLQKAGQGFLRSRKNSRWGRRKDLSLFVRSCCFCALLRGLKNLEVPRKGFNCCGAKLRLRCAVSRLAKPRSFLKKVLIVAVRSCGCGALIRGLKNLGTPCEGKRFSCFLRCAKRTKKHTRGLRTSGLRGRFKSPVDTVFL